MRNKNKRGLKISDRLQTGDQILLNMTEKLCVFQNIKFILKWENFMLLLLLGYQTWAQQNKLEPHSRLLHPAGFIASPCFQHITRSLSFCLFIWCLPPSGILWSSQPKSFTFNKQICQLKHQSPKAIKQWNTHVLARNLSNASLAHYKWSLQFRVFIWACIHTLSAFKDKSMVVQSPVSGMYIQTQWPYNLSVSRRDKIQKT